MSEAASEVLADLPPPEEEDPTTFEKIKEKLDANNVEYKHTHHVAVRTSKQAAEVRGAELKTGAKAMILRSKGKFNLVVMSAIRSLNLKSVKKALSQRNLSFATPDEVKELSGCIPGAVPPFGSVFGVQTYMDVSLRDVEEINFNAGLRTDSIRMKQSEYERVEKPIVIDVTVEMKDGEE